MSSIKFEQAQDLEDGLQKAADESGVNRDYWDVLGRRHDTTSEARKRILGSLGWPVNDFNALEQQRRAEFIKRFVTPLPSTAVRGEREKNIAVTLAGEAQGSLHYELQLEDGTTLSGDVPLVELTVGREIEFDGRQSKSYTLPLPVETPLGYHRLRISLNDIALGETQLILCPDRAYIPAWLADGGCAAGLNVTLYGLRSNRNWGCGDFTDVEALLDWAYHDVGFSFVGLNPLHAIHNRVPYNTSPYLPNSIYYKNWIYIDIERVPEFAHSRAAQTLFRSEPLRRELERLRSSEYVEYSAVDRLKRVFLKILHREFRRSKAANGERVQAFQKFCDREGALLQRFALYCTLDEQLHRRDRSLWTWPQWPEAYQDPESKECREFAQAYRRTIECYCYMQFVLEQQLEGACKFAKQIGMPIGLYHDLAVATDSFGSDLWAHRPFYVRGCRVGAPPDDFSPNGQDWAFPPPNTLAHRDNGYRMVRDSIRKVVHCGGALRIDHVMRLFRLFWIPDGMGAPDGTYVNDNAKDLLRILALESVRSQNVIIGEDLGTVTDQMRAALEHYGILSYRLLWFEKRPDGSFKRPFEYPRQSLVASSTHDLPTIAGFWTYRDVEARKSAGLIDDANYWRQREERKREKQRILDVLHEEGELPSDYSRNAEHVPTVDGTLHNAIVGFLAEMPSMLLLLNGEDYSKEENQQNLPGSTSQYPNWQRKAKMKLEDLRSPEWQPYTAMFRDQLKRTNRAAKAEKKR